MRNAMPSHRIAWPCCRIATHRQVRHRDAADAHDARLQPHHKARPLTRGQLAEDIQPQEGREPEEVSAATAAGLRSEAGRAVSEATQAVAISCTRTGAQSRENERKEGGTPLLYFTFAVHAPCSLSPHIWNGARTHVARGNASMRHLDHGAGPPGIPLPVSQKNA